MERESEMGEQEAGVRTFCILVNALAACDSSVVDCALCISNNKITLT